jgi:hypothetical protein
LLIMCFLLKLYLVRVAEYLLPMSEIEVVKFDKQCFWIHNISVLLNLFLDITWYTLSITKIWCNCKKENEARARKLIWSVPFSFMQSLLCILVAAIQKS